MGIYRKLDLATGEIIEIEMPEEVSNESDSE